MLRLLAVVLLLVPMLQAQDSALKELAGAYVAKGFERSGKPVPDAVLESVTAVKIADGKLTMTIGKKEWSAKLRVDSSKKIAEIDLFPLTGDYDKDRKFPGLFKLEKESLTILYVEDGERPKDFTGGAGSTKLVLVKKSP